ncbi:hypothetical protein BDV96DRAFT_599178 [Lophiotrema nucula]|uniref:Aminoglycoside phosphotransferase domain-containing protein n=1 Tax=Lophiotrema nucula TaxID=690887 RepID=A0A6A5ZBP5_9PLEO|nr:hypothetical protein BDV96DRAFT_599178 [Lophiotrema nucula]
MRSKATILQDHFKTTDEEEVFNILCSLPILLPALDYVSFTLPYTAPGVSDVPTAKDVSDYGEVLYKRNSADAVVYKVFDKYAVKVSPLQSLLQEAENLLFLEKVPQVHSTKVFAVFKGTADGEENYYLVMEHIPGPNITPEFWNSLDNEGRLLLGTKIGEQLKELRGIAQSQSTDSLFYGRVGGKGWSESFPPFHHFRGPHSGPFLNYQDLARAMAHSAEWCAAVGNVGVDDVPQHVKEVFQTFESELNNCKPEDQRPVLTHLLLEPSVFMIRPNKGQSKGDYDLVIISWKYMSWLPAWFETVRLRFGLRLMFIEDRQFREVESFRATVGDQILKVLGPMNMDPADYFIKARVELCLSLP